MRLYINDKPKLFYDCAVDVIGVVPISRGGEYMWREAVYCYHDHCARAYACDALYTIGTTVYCAREYSGEARGVNAGLKLLREYSTMDIVEREKGLSYKVVQKDVPLAVVDALIPKKAKEKLHPHWTPPTEQLRDVIAHGIVCLEAEADLMNALARYMRELYDMPAEGEEEA